MRVIRQSEIAEEAVVVSEAHSPDRQIKTNTHFGYIARPPGENSLSGSNLVSVSLASASLWMLSKAATIASAGQHPHSQLESRAGTAVVMTEIKCFFLSHLNTVILL